jgi:hypothetical protein
LSNVSLAFDSTGPNAASVSINVIPLFSSVHEDVAEE